MPAAYPLTSLRPRSNRSAASSTSCLPRSNMSRLASTMLLLVSDTASLLCCTLPARYRRVCLPVLGVYKTATAAPINAPARNHATLPVKFDCVSSVRSAISSVMGMGASMDILRYPGGMAQDPGHEEDSAGEDQLDSSSELDMVTLYDAPIVDAEMEADMIQGVLESNGIPSILVRNSILPSLGFEVKVPRPRRRGPPKRRPSGLSRGRQSATRGSRADEGVRPTFAQSIVAAASSPGERCGAAICDKPFRSG